MIHCICICSHINPAVSLAFLVTGELPLVRFLLYVAAQLAGSSLACGALRVALPAHYFAQVNVNGSSFSFGVTLPSTTDQFEMCTPYAKWILQHSGVETVSVAWASKVSYLRARGRGGGRVLPRFFIVM